MPPSTPIIHIPSHPFGSFVFPGRNTFKFLPSEIYFWIYIGSLISLSLLVLWRHYSSIRRFPEQKWERKLYWSLAFLGLCCHAAYIDAVIEDAYIISRYISNALAGYGLSWNRGEPPLEGFSTLLFTLLNLGVAKLGLSTTDASRVISLFSGCITLVLVDRLLRKLLEHRSLREFIPVLLISHPTIGCYVGGGLETAFFGMILVATLLAYCSERRIAASILAASSWSTRPDGVILFVVFMSLEVFRSWKRKHYRNLFEMGIPFLSLVLVVTIFRWTYFGDLIPNSARAKLMVDTNSLGAGFLYLQSFTLAGFGILEHLGLGVLLILGKWWPHRVFPIFFAFLLVLLLRELGMALVSRHFAIPILLTCLGILFLKGWQNLREEFWWLIGLVLFQSLAVVAIGGDWMPAFRYLYPVALLSIITLALALDSYLNSQHTHAIAPLVMLLVSIPLFIFQLTRTSDIHRHYRRAENQLSDAAVLATTLKKEDGHSYSVAGIAVGVFGYLYDGKVLDVCGLNDRKITRSPKRFRAAGHSMCDFNHVISRHPDIMLPGMDQHQTITSLEPFIEGSKYQPIVLQFQYQDAAKYSTVWVRNDIMSEVTTYLARKSTKQP